VGNLIHKDWGVYRLPAAGTGSSILASGVPNVINVALVSAKVGAAEYLFYGFPYQIAPTATSAGVPYTHSWKDDTSLASAGKCNSGYGICSIKSPSGLRL